MDVKKVAFAVFASEFGLQFVSLSGWKILFCRMLRGTYWDGDGAGFKRTEWYLKVFVKGGELKRLSPKGFTCAVNSEPVWGCETWKSADFRD